MGSVSKYVLFAISIALAHFVWVMAYFEPAISTPDANGYFAQARHLVEHGQTWFETKSPVQYVGMHWLTEDGHRYYSHYPPGMSVLLAAFWFIGGPIAALWMNPILTALTLFGLFFLARIWVDEPWALLAVVVMAINPVVAQFALGCDSHPTVAFLLVWGLYLLVTWARTGEYFWAFGAGLLLGAIPTVRYAEAIYAVGIGLYVLVLLKNNPSRWRGVLVLSLGAAIPIVALLVRNALAFGAFWKTGYSLTAEQTAFSISNLMAHAPLYLQNILGEGMGFWAAFALMGLVLLCMRSETQHVGGLFAGIVFPSLLLYMAYYFAPENMAAPTLRFLLPIFYVMIVAGVWVFKMLNDLHPQMARGSVITLMVVTVVWGVPQSTMVLARAENSNMTATRITQALRTHVKPGAIVFASQNIQEHLDFLGEWQLMDEAVMTYQSRGEARDDGPAVGMRQVRAKRLRALEPFVDDWGNGASEALMCELDRLNGSQSVLYWVGSYEHIFMQVPVSDRVEVIARIDVSDINNRQRGRGGRGGGAMGRGFGGRGMDTEDLVLVQWTRGD